MKTTFLSFLIGIGLYMPLKAQWSTNPSLNNPISVATDEQLAPKVVSDNAGGAIMVWNDYRNSSTSYIYSQRINAAGYVQWTTDGVMLGKSVSYQQQPAIIADGFGGAIVSWIDSSSIGITLYMQRLNDAGAEQWTAGGIAIATITTNNMSLPELLADGSGGATVTWSDNRAGGYTAARIYVQQVNSAGIALYSANGLAISSNTSAQFTPKLISDGAGGAIITYVDFRNGVDGNIYAQRINAAGAIQWPLDGMAVTTASNWQSDPKIVSDGSGGAIIIWQDGRNGTYDIYYQCINAAGIVQWASNGLILSASTVGQGPFSILEDGAGGFFVAWDKYGTGLAYFDVYAQRVNQSGVAQWTTNGNAIGTGQYDQHNASIISDGAGGIIVTWDTYVGGTTGTDIYAQRINASGTNLWALNGAIISNALYAQSYPVLVSDGASGAIVAWQDVRSALYNDIYAQKIGASGIICSAAPASPSAVTGTTNVCPNTSQNYSVTNDVNVNIYTWTLPNGWSGTTTTNSISVYTSTNSGLIQVMGSNTCGSTSVSSLSVTVSPLLDVTVTQANAVLTVATAGASYQWYTCPNFIFAPGIFYNQSYTVPSNGDYAVSVTQNGCTHTSSCVTVSDVSVNELTEAMHFLNVYPNPSNGNFIVKSDMAGDFSIVNAIGEQVTSFKLNETNNYSKSINTLASGIYMVMCTSNNAVLKQKVIIER